MTAVELLQQKYKETDHVKVTDWMRESKIKLSLQTCTNILLRGKQMGVVAMLTMASALNCTPEEIKYIAKEVDDDCLWRLFVKGEATQEESSLIDNYRLLNPSQKRIINTMIEEMLK